MPVIAHAGHYALGLLEVTPVLIVVVVAIWNSVVNRKQRRSDGDVAPERRSEAGTTGPHA